MNNDTAQAARSSFDANEESWFASPPRLSRRPSSPAPSMPPSSSSERLDDSIADGWFYDV